MSINNTATKTMLSTKKNIYLESLIFTDGKTIIYVIALLQNKKNNLKNICFGTLNS